MYDPANPVNRYASQLITKKVIKVFHFLIATKF